MNFDLDRPSVSASSCTSKCLRKFLEKLVHVDVPVPVARDSAAEPSGLLGMPS
jgi:hypothetical protein